MINEEKGPGFCLPLQQASVSHQPQTYLRTKESSKLRNVALIPWASKKVRLCSLTGVQGPISWSVRGGVLIRTCWSSLQALRSWHPQKPCMWCWPSHESELKQHAEECPHISCKVVPLPRTCVKTPTECSEKNKRQPLNSIYLAVFVFSLFTP